MSHFDKVGGARPGRSMFNLSYEKKFTTDMGKLIPILAEEAIPGDIWTIGNQMVLRMTPLVAPILHEVDVYVHYYFVPNRILYPEADLNWEEYITGGVDGEDDTVLPVMSGPFAKGDLGDYLGMPIGITIPVNNSPLAIPWEAYRVIFNEYYRDEWLQTEIASPNNTVLNRNWRKDYFTSALKDQQRGISPAIPIGGTTQAIWDPAIYDTATSQGVMSFHNTGTNARPIINDVGSVSNAFGFFNSNTVNLASATPLDINNLREAFQIQRFMERNARAGVRYTEFLRAHFNTSPRDERLQRPEYIGGCKCPVIVSEVLQTSKTDGSAYQGNMAGHGIAVNQEFISKYHVQEFGVIMGIFSVMPKAAYQQGINRQWLRRTRYEWFFPEFAHLSEQAITVNEIYTSTVEADNNTVFGFCGAYDEMRVKQDMVCGNFRDTYDYWHIGRQFGSQPALNSSFITCTPRKDCFAVQNEDCLLVQFGNLITALRPMPIIAEPGLIDHG